MLQRSPSYILSLPGFDNISRLLGSFLPARWVYRNARSRYIKIQRYLYKAARRWPNGMRKLLIWAVEKQLGGKSDLRNFTPRYQPWDERLCIVPDGDLFAAIRSGKASVVTGEIDTFTERGILLKSGQALDADIIVTATGLNLQMLGGIEVKVDGRSCDYGKLMTYKGVLMQDAPNLAWIMGYTNASWTLKADIAARYICRLLNQMNKKDYASFVARAPEGEMQAESIMDSLGSGYVRRAESILPRQGRALPWRMLHAYEIDSKMLAGPLDDGCLQFAGQPVPA
jgi:cation diffusion facilitator CzcD-associated flavoprotein CzcO